MRAKGCQQRLSGTERRLLLSSDAEDNAEHVGYSRPVARRVLPGEHSAERIDHVEPSVRNAAGFRSGELRLDRAKQASPFLDVIALQSQQAFALFVSEVR